MKVPRLFFGVALLAVSCLLSYASAQPARGDLHVYFVDVEGGQATLFVPAGGESLLIDTGWPDNNGRDADRIVTAAHKAGLQRIDYVLITHFHDDHVGGVPQLLDRIPVGTFLDHGDLYENDHGSIEQKYKLYLQQIAAGRTKRLVLHAGDRLPVRGLNGTVISSDGKVIGQPLPGAGQTNPLCAQETAAPEDTTENGHSLGVLLHYAGVTVLDLGDLTKDRERTLVCPVNRIGKVDIEVVSHHGWEQSSSRAFVHALQPRVAIMDNGAKKGGSVPVLDVFRSSPGLETLWQLHTSEEGAATGPNHNTAEQYIANSPGEDGRMLELVIHPNGSYDVTNDRTGKTVHYAARR